MVKQTGLITLHNKATELSVCTKIIQNNNNKINNLLFEIGKKTQKVGKPYAPFSL